MSEKLLLKIAELSLFGLGTRHTCLSLLSSFRFLILSMFYTSQQPLSALYFEKTSAFQFNTTLSESNSLSVNLHFKCSISCRIGLFDAKSVSVGLSEKTEQLDSPSSVSDFIENSFCEDFNSLILFKMHLSSCLKCTYPL